MLKNVNKKLINNQMFWRDLSYNPIVPYRLPTIPNQTLAFIGFQKIRCSTIKLECQKADSWLEKSLTLSDILYLYYPLGSILLQTFLPDHENNRVCPKTCLKSTLRGFRGKAIPLPTFWLKTRENAILTPYLRSFYPSLMEKGIPPLIHFKPSHKFEILTWVAGLYHSKRLATFLKTTIFKLFLK